MLASILFFMEKFRYTVYLAKKTERGFLHVRGF